VLGVPGVRSGMRSRQAPKKEKAEDDEDTKALKAKQQADAKAMKDAREKGASWRSEAGAVG
jgi:hypothetical protein